jgi:hypothetical protein
MEASKRYRVDTEKLQKAVAEVLAARRENKVNTKVKPRDRSQPHSQLRIKFVAKCQLHFAIFH